MRQARTTVLAATIAAMLSPEAHAKPADPAVLAANPALDALEAATPGALDVVFRNGGTVPTFVAGKFPSQAGLPEITALAFLEAHGGVFGIEGTGGLVIDHVIDVGWGSVVRWHQAIDGIPVEFSSVTVRTDVSGRPRAVLVNVVPAAAVESTVPAFGPAEAAVIAQDAASEAFLAHLGEDAATLVILPLPGGDARLAWKVVPGAVPALLSNPIVYIDAITGETLLVRNGIWTDRLASVYTENPIRTPTPVEVTLPNMPALSTNLTGTRTVARNCLDLHETTTITYLGITLALHTCSEVQKATADGSGDFVFTPDPLAPEDDFAEAQMYYSVERAYDYYNSLGFDLLNEVPIPATVNFRAPIDVYGAVDLAAIMAATDPYGVLYPFDNAMFVEAGNLLDILTRPDDSMVFGQGTEGDFAYDGDVVTHELGHAVVAATCALTGYSYDEQGLDASTGALNEGFADTGAAFMTGDSVVGDYAGSWLTGGGIRDIDADNSCPGDMMGESHYDSLMFTGAEWDAGEALTADLDTLRAAFFAAEITLSPMSDFDEASAALVAAVETSLGTDAATTMANALDAHNVSACQRIVDLAEGIPLSTILVVPAQAMVLVREPLVPGPVQLRFNAARGFQQLNLSFRVQPDPYATFLGGGTPTPAVLFKRGPDPITFGYTGTAVTGDWDQILEPSAMSAGYYEVNFWIDGEGIPAGDYYFMIGSGGQAGLQAYQIRAIGTDVPYPVEEDEAEPVPETPEPEPDAVDEVEPTPDADADAGDGGGRDEGCGCTLAS